MPPNLAYMGPSCGRLLTKSETAIPPRQLQLGGTTSSSVGIGWDPSFGSNDDRPRVSCRKDCDRGSTIGFGVPIDRSTVGATMGGPPVFTDLPNCCWFEAPAAEVFGGDAWFPTVEVVEVVTSVEPARRRLNLEPPASSESSVDACNGRLILRG